MWIKKLVVVLYLLIFTKYIEAKSITKPDPALEKHLLEYRQIRFLIYDLIGSTTGSLKEIQKGRNQNKYQDVVPDSSPFPCNITNMRSEIRPTSVHKIRPGDIDIICAMGDSLSAGNGAASYSNVAQIYVENRGLSFTGGGQSTWREFLTLPNILKVFNPKLLGFSFGDSLTIMKEAQFNVAEPAALSDDLPYMARELTRRVKNDKRVNFESDWKLVSILMGANNICSDVCYEKSPEQYIESHRNHLLDTLRYFRDAMPRTIVNLILTPSFGNLDQFADKGVWPWLKHTGCSCLFGDKFVDKRDYFLKVNKQWQQIDEEVSQMPEFTESDTFQVILQPFLTHPTFPPNKEDQNILSYMAVDNFHFSQKGHALGANDLWNNMLEPVGNKTEFLTPPVFSRFLCPSEDHPYFYTARNSRN